MGSTSTSLHNANTDFGNETQSNPNLGTNVQIHLCVYIM